LIVGGGLAGLAAASDLSARGYVVTVLEQAAHLGGRLLASYCPEGPSDAWPPVLMGHQAATLALLDEVGTRMRVAFSNSLCLELQLSDGRLACLMQPWFPSI
jgi:monoamine oxidase